MQLLLAQTNRRARGEALVLAQIDAMVEELCDAVELADDLKLAGSDAVKNYQLVGPDARKKLSGLINHYRKDPHPFTACVRDNRKRFGASAEKVCAVLTDLEKGTTKWRSGGKKGVSASLAQPDIDNELGDLLLAISGIPYREIIGLDEGEDFAVLSSKKRASLKSSDFVFPKTKSYPMHDRQHGANALARAKDKPEHPQVKAAVCKRYPDLPMCKEDS